MSKLNNNPKKRKALKIVLIVVLVILLVLLLTVISAFAFYKSKLNKIQRPDPVEDGVDEVTGTIDENDPVWSKLQIWTKDELGRDIMYHLADKNVGAIYLGNARTDFSLIGNTGETEGIIRKTGVFLYENGLAGTIQHLDLAAYRKEA